MQAPFGLSKGQGPKSRPEALPENPVKTTWSGPKGRVSASEQRSVLPVSDSLYGFSKARGRVMAYQKALMLLVVLAGCAGCQYSPDMLDRTIAYNRAVANSTNQVLLLNVV